MNPDRLWNNHLRPGLEHIRWPGSFQTNAIMRSAELAAWSLSL